VNENDDQRSKRRGKDWLQHGSLASRLRCRNERLSNQFWTVRSLVAIKRKKESLGRTMREVCSSLLDGESEEPRE